MYPADVVVPSVDEADRAKDERRLVSLGIARQKGRAMPMEPIHVGERPASQPWSRAPRASGASIRPRSARTSRSGRRCSRRSTGSSTTQELFDFEYTLEMYKPAAKRRWGYFALPILHVDRLVGKVDAKADHKASVLCVHAIHEDVKFTRTMTKAVHEELEDLAPWLELGAVEPA